MSPGRFPREPPTARSPTWPPHFFLAAISKGKRKKNPVGPYGDGSSARNTKSTAPLGFHAKPTTRAPSVASFSHAWPANARRCYCAGRPAGRRRGGGRRGGRRRARRAAGGQRAAYRFLSPKVIVLYILTQKYYILTRVTRGSH